MLKTKKIICSIAAFLLVGAMSKMAYAAPIDRMDIIRNETSQHVTLSGSFPEVPFGRLSVTVLQGGVTPESLQSVTKETFSQIINHFGQVKTSESGSYTYSFKMTGEKGSPYTVVFNYYMGSELIVSEEKIYFFTLQDVDSCLEDLNDSGTSADIKTALDAWDTLLNLDKSLYSSFGENESEGKDFVHDYMLTKLKLYENGFSDVGQVKKDFYDGCLLYALKTIEDGDAFIKFFEDNDVALNWSSHNAYEAYSALSSSSKTTVANGIISNIETIKTLDELKAELAKSVVLQSIKDMSNWGGVKPLLLKNVDTLSGLNITKYKALKDTSAIDKKIVGKAFSDIEELCTTINTKLENLLSGSSGSDGGNYPSSPSGGSLPAISVKPDINETKPILPSKDTDNMPFTDVSADHWAKEAISNLYSSGVIKGKTANLFMPEDNITREEFTKLIVEIFDLYDENAEVDFYDVDKDAWYYKYVASAYKTGVVKGMGDSFGIGDAITRQDVAVLLCRAAGIEDKISFANRFTDNDAISSYALESVDALVSAGIINGFEDGSFAPMKSTTRAQAAKILYALIKGRR